MGLDKGKLSAETAKTPETWEEFYVYIRRFDEIESRRGVYPAEYWVKSIQDAVDILKRMPDNPKLNSYLINSITNEHNLRDIFECLLKKETENKPQVQSPEKPVERVSGWRKILRRFLSFKGK